jgi:Cdc6-like AAA superfamily ATPase
MAIPDEVSIQSATTREATLRLPYLDAKSGSNNQVLEKWKHENDFSPSAVAELFAKRHSILIVDEFDALTNVADRFKLAEFIKHLSDNKSNVKLLVVGIATSGSELLAGHPSVQRCLKETKLEKMPDGEIRKIVESGAAKAKLHFDTDVLTAIVSLSSGYPHFTHLLCLKSAELVIGRDQNIISMDVLKTAMASCIDDVEGSLRTAFDHATRSVSTEMYKLLLLAAAQIRTREFSAQTWRDAYEHLIGTPLKKQALNTYLDRLVTDAQTAVLKRVARGMYCFIDPRMPSFVRIEAGQRGLLLFDKPPAAAG